MVWLLLFGAGVVAFVISAVSGGGAGLLLMPVLRWVLPAAQVPAALSIGSTVSSASRIGLFFRHIHWPVVRWFVPAALPCVWLGAWLLAHVEPAYLEAALGLFLIANLPLLLRGTSTTARTKALPPWSLSLMGGVAGFVSGLTGAVGLLFNRFYLQYGLRKEQIIATRAANEIILHAIKLVLYGLFGLLTPKVMLAGALIASAALLATALARRVLPCMSEALFRRIGYGAMVASGVFMCSSAGAVIAQRHPLAVHASGSRQGFDGRLDWRDARLALEFKYKEGFEFEQVIAWNELPACRQARALWWVQPGDEVVVEEVRTLRGRSYELYVLRDGVLRKHHF